MRVKREAARFEQRHAYWSWNPEICADGPLVSGVGQRDERVPISKRATLSPKTLDPTLTAFQKSHRH